MNPNTGSRSAIGPLVGLTGHHEPHSAALPQVRDNKAHEVAMAQ
jgi:hypothetical protein